MRRIHPRSQPSAARALGLAAWAAAAALGSLGAARAQAPAQPTTSAAAAATQVAPGVTVRRDPSLRTHTIFHPALTGKAKLPLLVWENGACANDPTPYTPLLSQIAARGYVVIAKGQAGLARPAAAGQAPTAPPARPTLALPADGTFPAGPLFPSTRPADKQPDELMLKAIAWAEAEDRRAGSDFLGRIDTGRVGLIGYSCGGFTALQVAPLKKNVGSVFVLNSGTNPAWTADQGRKLLATYRPGVPVAWVNGGPSDMAYVPGQRDWTLIPDTMPALHAEYDYKPPEGAAPLDNGHSMFWLGPRSLHYQAQLAEMASNWFEYTLRSGDDRAMRYFQATPCGFCRADPLWSVQRKNWNTFTRPTPSVTPAAGG